MGKKKFAHKQSQEQKLKVKKQRDERKGIKETKRTREIKMNTRFCRELQNLFTHSWKKKKQGKKETRRKEDT